MAQQDPNRPAKPNLASQKRLAWSWHGEELPRKQAATSSPPHGGLGEG